MRGRESEHILKNPHFGARIGFVMMMVMDWEFEWDWRRSPASRIGVVMTWWWTGCGGNGIDSVIEEMFEVPVQTAACFTDVCCQNESGLCSVTSSGVSEVVAGPYGHGLINPIGKNAKMML